MRFYEESRNFLQKYSAKIFTLSKHKAQRYLAERYSAESTFAVSQETSSTLACWACRPPGRCNISACGLLCLHPWDLTVFLLVTAAMQPVYHQQLPVWMASFSSTPLPWWTSPCRAELGSWTNFQQQQLLTHCTQPGNTCAVSCRLPHDHSSMVLNWLMVLWGTLAQPQPASVAARGLQRPSIHEAAVGRLVEPFLLCHQTGAQPVQTKLVSDFPDSSSEPRCIWLTIKVSGLPALSAKQSLQAAPTASLLWSHSWPNWIN